MGRPPLGTCLLPSLAGFLAAKAELLVQVKDVTSMCSLASRGAMSVFGEAQLGKQAWRTLGIKKKEWLGSGHGSDLEHACTT